MNTTCANTLAEHRYNEGTVHDTHGQEIAEHAFTATETLSMGEWLEQTADLVACLHITLANIAGVQVKASNVDAAVYDLGRKLEELGESLRDDVRAAAADCGMSDDDASDYIYESKGWDSENCKRLETIFNALSALDLDFERNPA